MTEREELLRSPVYWLTHLQIEIFNLLNTYMEENNLTQMQVAEKLNVSPSYVSQILNGNFNFTISRLIELALLVGKAPIIQFETIEQILRAEATQLKAEAKSKKKNLWTCLAQLQVLLLIKGHRFHKRTFMEYF